MPSYTFTYLNAEGQSLAVLSADCADDDSATDGAVQRKVPRAAAVEIWRENRVVAKRRLDSM